jgi:hypothetical protein
MAQASRYNFLSRYRRIVYFRDQFCYGDAMRGRRSTFWFAAGLLWACGAYAQPSQPERVPEQARRDATTTEQAAEAARNRTGPGGPPVTFEQILRNPDDINLNFRYAEQKVQEGDLKSASTTLERILLVSPDLTQIRLLYAIVLFRLDNLQEAEREFRAVAAQPVAADVRADVADYLDQISKRNQLTRVSASIGAGFDFNSNRDAFPRSKHRLVNDVATPGSPGGNADIGQILLGTIGIRHDLGTQDRHEVIVNATGYFNNQVEVDTQDLRALALEAGGVYRTPWADFTPTLTYTRVSLNHEHFLDARGAKLRAEKQLNPRLDVYASIWAQYQNFAATSAALAAPERSGPRYDFEIGANYVLTPTHRVGASLVHTDKYAARNYQDYFGNELTASHTWLLGRGQFLLSSLSAGRDVYEDPDIALVSARTRRDTNLRFRSTYGAPLETIFGAIGVELPDYVSDITFTVGLELFRSYSNITNFEYDNVKLQTLLTKRFDW